MYNEFELNGVYYTMTGTGYCYAIENKKKVRISRAEYDAAEMEYINSESGPAVPSVEDKPSKTKKAKKSKDVAFECEGVTLTTKQADFIRHLPDTCFWENGLDSCIWVDCLCDDIGGQFKGKPMTVGAMISTLCEKGLGSRCRENRDGRKCTSFELTELGKKVAAGLGL